MKTKNIKSISRKIALSLACCSFGLLSMAQVKYSIEGKVKNAPKGESPYIYRVGGGPLDSVLVKNGTFRFAGEGNQGAQVYLSRTPRGVMDPKAMTPLYIDKGRIKVTLDYTDYSKSTVRGSKTQDEYAQFERTIAVHRDKLAPINEAYKKANKEYAELRKQGEGAKDKVAEKSAQLEQLREDMSQYQQAIIAEIPKFIRNNPGSYVSANLLFSYLTSFSLEEADELYQGLLPEIRNSQSGKKAGDKIASIKGGSVGSKASVFTSIGIDGQSLSLADFKGLYVLLDFWASWCVPCRKGNPHLIQVYNTYHDKGFEIIGIASDDSTPDAWRKAVTDDQIHIWKHVLSGLKKRSDGEYDRSGYISGSYGISTLPTKILIDPNGMIVGRYGSNGGTDADLDKKLQEIFAGK